MPTFRQDAHLGTKVPLMKTEDYNNLSVTTEKLADESVTSEKLADFSVINDKIEDFALMTRHFGTECIPDYALSVGCVATKNIQDGAVTTDKLADESVTYGKLADGAVGEEKIADSAIQNRHYSKFSISEDKLGYDCVTTSKIKDEAVTMQKLEDYVQQTIGASLYDAVCRYEFTDVDEAGQDRHMKINLFQWRNNEGTNDHLSGSVPTANNTYDGLMSATSYRTLASVKSTADKLNDKYLRRDGALYMTGNLLMGGHEVQGVTILRDNNNNLEGSVFVSFKDNDYDIAFGKVVGVKVGTDAQTGKDLYNTVDKSYAGFKSNDFYLASGYSHAVGFKTTNQTYYGLLANNGETIQAMSDSDVTSVANAVFNS